MAEYIDRKKIFPNGVFFANANDPLKSLDELIKRIYSLPAADVVEVVRCKDCKHCDFGEWQFAVCAKRSEYHNFTVRKDDFCNYGERRSE